MNALKAISIVVATISIPLLSFFLIRLTLKVSRGVDHLNRTLDDIRPQLNMLLSNLNQTMDEVNDELERVGKITGEAQEMLEITGSSLRSVEEALRSPVARLGGMLAGFATTTFLFRGMTRRAARRVHRQRRRRAA
jgi:uncharacterized protein YoxC